MDPDLLDLDLEPRKYTDSDQSGKISTNSKQNLLSNPKSEERLLKFQDLCMVDPSFSIKYAKKEEK